MKKFIFPISLLASCIMNASAIDVTVTTTMKGIYHSGGILWGFVSWERCEPSEDVCKTVIVTTSDGEMKVGDPAEVIIYPDNTPQTRSGVVVNIETNGDPTVYVQP